jgi:hypothetical protein
LCIGVVPFPGLEGVSGFLFLKLASSLKSKMLGVDRGRSFGVGGHS